MMFSLHHYGQYGHLVIWSFGQFGQYGHLVIWSSGPLVYSSSGRLVVFNIVKDCTILMEHNNE